MEILDVSGRRMRPTKKTSSEELEKLRKEANKNVKGIFRCHEPKNGEVTLVWREYKGDPVRRWTLRDGQEYEIPLGLAKHLNNNCKYYIHKHIMNSDGTPALDRKAQATQRMEFVSTAYF